MEKKYRKSRMVARVVMIALIAVSILFGAGRSLSNQRSRTEKTFYAADTGIQRDLDSIAGLASNYETVAKRYLPASDAALVSLQLAKQDLEKAKSLDEKKAANAALGEALDAVYEALGSCDMSESDAGYRQSLRAEYASYNQIMGHSAYNDAAAQFNQLIKRFPTSLFGRLTGIGELPTFS